MNAFLIVTTCLWFGYWARSIQVRYVQHRAAADLRYHAFIAEAVKSMTPAQARRFFEPECQDGCRCRRNAASDQLAESRVCREALNAC